MRSTFLRWLVNILVCFSILCLRGAVASANDNTETAGNLLRVVIPAVAYSLTFNYDDSPGRIQFYKSFLSTLGVTYALKEIVDKERPNGKSDAFPSGHASMSFQGASFIQVRYGWKIGAPAYMGAAFVGWSRMDADEHDFADVFAGAVIGVAGTFLFTTRYFPDVEITPIVSKPKMGFMLSAKW